MRRYLYTVPGLKCGYAFIIQLAPMGEILEITDLSVRRPVRSHLWLNSPLEKDKIYISTVTDCYTAPPRRKRTPSSGSGTKNYGSVPEKELTRMRAMCKAQVLKLPAQLEVGLALCVCEQGSPVLKASKA